ncbi:hypothetical protein [Stenotrophomonas sp. MMGLT7]|uniref:hypothetical protein n=1 Tax=Stenotrophomonas sp. MMGLT7 TaxID=2901227 RepID=UPI001E4CA697|nr:hypothetical protein [Stenotrophomonas sp. MMGLT7]MCD7099538.1 hypothetical protein [Stenotrophomonas sp. MMGLT7]
MVVSDGEPALADRDNCIKVQFPRQRGSDASSGQAHPAGEDNAPGRGSAWAWVRVATMSLSIGAAESVPFLEHLLSKAVNPLWRKSLELLTGLFARLAANEILWGEFQNLVGSLGLGRIGGDGVDLDVDA